jgi:hypothetical protein
MPVRRNRVGGEAVSPYTPSSLGLVSIAHDSLVCLRATPCEQ